MREPNPLDSNWQTAATEREARQDSGFPKTLGLRISGNPHPAISQFF
jgi:hypothetical protein